MDLLHVPLCWHGHRLKHEGGWRLRQPEPGNFVWTSRLGHTYQHQPAAIIEPLPDPIPRDRHPYPLTIPLDDGWENTEIWEDSPPEPDLEPEPDPPPEPNPSTDIPPF
ncbi:MAG: hypothetical protein ACRDTD_12170 [Pseudonocardiaceae bacterium]